MEVIEPLGSEPNMIAPPQMASCSNRKTMGRSARRRRKKLLEILKAEEMILLDPAVAVPASGTEEDPKSSRRVIPMDRDLVWPGVQERRAMAEGGGQFWSQEDAIRVRSQLGYLPGNATRVAARASSVPLLQTRGVDAEEPVVLQLYPIAVRDEHAGGKKANGTKKQRKRLRTMTTKEGGDRKMDDFVVEPFPTLYWLTLPLLRTLVSKLELQSMGVQLEKRLAQDPAALASMERANAAYGLERYNLLTTSDTAFVQQRKWEGAFDPKRGVAGIRNYGSVKCLHAHVAHHLSQGKGSADNIVGQWVMEEIEKACQARRNDVATGTENIGTAVVQKGDQ